MSFSYFYQDLEIERCIIFAKLNSCLKNICFPFSLSKKWHEVNVCKPKKYKTNILEKKCSWKVKEKSFSKVSILKPDRSHFVLKISHLMFFWKSKSTSCKMQTICYKNVSSQNSIFEIEFSKEELWKIESFYSSRKDLSLEVTHTYTSR